MHIAVDAHAIKAAYTEEEHFMLALLYQLIQSRPGHHFTIICLQEGLLPALPNITESVIVTALNSYFQLHRWHSSTLPETIRKLGADVLISLNSAAGKAIIPCIVFMSSPNATKRTFTNKFFSLLYKKYVNRHIAKADAIVTCTHLQRSVIAKYFGVKENRVIPVGYTVPPVFKPISWQQKETILEKYTHGSEYFFYAGSFTENTFILVLKAFSLFKKRQLSSMQLIAAGSFAVGKDVTEKLATYKYRADIKSYENATMETIASLMSGAYAVIYLDEKVLTAFPAAAALQCEVPVIGLEDDAAFKEVAGSAGLYVSPTPESLAEQMKLLYKDENLRKQLVENAAVQMPLINGISASQKALGLYRYNCGKIPPTFTAQKRTGNMINSKITVHVTLDDNRVPQGINWAATESSADEPQKSKAMMLNFWDGADKAALRIDLWTKEMMVDEMADFYFQTMMGMADSFQRSTGQTALVAEMKNFAQAFYKKFQDLQQKEGNRQQTTDDGQQTTESN